MIVRERPSGLRLYFVFKGSMLQSIRWQLVSTILVAVAVYLTHGTLFAIKITMTPTPFSYPLLIHRTAYLYCFMLPFGLVDSIGFMTPFVVGLISYTFFGLDALGDEIAEPWHQPKYLGITSHD